MKKNIHELIKDILEEDSRLTQKGLAQCLGLNPAAVNRMLHGMRQIKANEIPVIENYLGVKLDISGASVGDNMNAIRAVASIMRDKMPNSSENTKLIPVYNGNWDVIDEIVPHPLQSNMGGGFAFYVQSDNMDPRFFYGELVYAQRGRPPEKNRDCLVEFADGSRKVFLLLDTEGDLLKLKQFNPEKVVETKISEVKSVIAIVGKN